ncbi:vacuolar protein sorting-associated protein [Ceratobasidium sp. AG-Ba]|nr:vacuolar protein sorting-associated protein [Ceratobasidium sp. AG-Ba]
MFGFAASVVIALASLQLAGAVPQAYKWKNVKIGGGGGFVPGIVFNTKEKGLAYARTDIGGLYKLNPDDSWTPLLDFANSATWNYWGVDAVATDPVEPKRLYAVTGMYTNSWDPNNGQVMRSLDYGKTWAITKLPFKVGGNMPGRGLGERLAIDPNKNSILFFGARSGNGLWKSTDYGVTFTKVSSFTNTGTYIADPSDASGYNSDKTGIAWVTFDSTSSTAGKATPRIFVGVANTNANSVFVSNDGGSTWSAVAGQPTTYMPHHGVLSPSEKVLYLTYNNNAGPYDGTLGAVYKYNIATSTWTDITPVSGSDLTFGFSGLAVDLQKPGTIMVAPLNEWWPDSQVFRSNNSGASWSRLWEWTSYPDMNRYYKYDVSLAPWLNPPGNTDTKFIGWMMQSLVIDPFDSNHWLYGTGATIFGGRDLTKWDTVHNITLKSLADGIEETAVLALISPPSGPNLLSGVGDIGGFVHSSFTTAPKYAYLNPHYVTTPDMDYAGLKPATVVRIGNDGSDGNKQVALSTDSGATWSPYSPTPAATSSVIASDKKNATVFYAATGGKFYLSTDYGSTFTATAGSLGSSTSPYKIAANPNVAGDVWVSTDKGLYHSTNYGATFTTVSGVSQAWAIGLGAPKTSGAYASVFAAATISGVTGYFRSDNSGSTWVQIDDPAHGFGSPTANPLSGDPRIYGRVYIGTNGRGIFYGDIA